MARYICIEGTEGVGKTTQTEKLVKHLRDKGFSVLRTKEPGTSLSPLTMKLRGIMLDNQYDDEITNTARELISQAIRSVHLEQIIKPAMNRYDFIIQDRGILSGLAYGAACGNSIEWLQDLAETVAEPMTLNPYGLYDAVLYLTGDVSRGLQTALNSKQEFEGGDAIESKGDAFLHVVSQNMYEFSPWFNTKEVDVDGKNIDEVFAEMLKVLELG
jgi:dTMP kinase